MANTCLPEYPEGDTLLGYFNANRTLIKDGTLLKACSLWLANKTLRNNML